MTKTATGKTVVKGCKKYLLSNRNDNWFVIGNRIFILSKQFVKLLLK